MFPTAEAKRCKKSLKRTTAATSIPVTVADLRSLVNRFSAVPADLHQGYVVTIYDIKHESSLIVMTRQALAANVQRCKENVGCRVARV